MASMPPGVSGAIRGMFLRIQRRPVSTGTVPSSATVRTCTACSPTPSASSGRSPAKKRNWLVSQTSFHSRSYTSAAEPVASISRATAARRGSTWASESTPHSYHGPARPPVRPLLAVLGPAPHAAGGRAGLARRAPGRGDAEDAHRLEPEAEALAAVGRAHVEAGEVAHALEPVADGVAVGVEPLRRARHIAVALEEGLERLDEVGLVLGVVGGERLDGLGVEALELGRVLAHRRQQQAVGPRVLASEHPGRLCP